MLIFCCAFFTVFTSPITVAGSGLLFNVLATGTPATVGISLCLDGRIPLTCEDHTIQNLNLLIKTLIPNQVYPFAGIKVNNAGYVLAGCTPTNNGYCLFSTNNTTPTSIFVSRVNANLPWFPSLEAFEHYDSGRSHVFPQAQFRGSFAGKNTVKAIRSTASYPSGYNMAYLNTNQAFIYGGGYGDITGSIGAFVAKVNPSSLKPIWYKQLIDTHVNGEWDYPGSMGILHNGLLYVSYGYRLAKLNPTTGKVIATLVLPTGDAEPANTAFNGFNATADGTLIMQSVYREAGCTIQGPNALLYCPDPANVPPSILVSVNPHTMKVIDTVTLSAPVGGRPTIGRFRGREFVYLIEATTAIRYSVDAGKFKRDTSWNPGIITISGQTISSSFVVMNDWVVAQTNTLPAATPLSLIAINQGDASQQFQLQPFLEDPIPSLVASAFATAAPGGVAAISWAPMSVSADPLHDLIYASDALSGRIAAIRLTPQGLRTIWKAHQTTTEFTTLIGPKESRVIVGTDIPQSEIPGNNSHDYAVWRNAQTGHEMARSPLLPAMTQGTMIQPYYFGDMFYEGQSGTLIKLRPTPKIE